MNKIFLTRLAGLWLLATLGSALAEGPIADDAAKPEAKSDPKSDAKSETKDDPKIFEEPSPSVTAHSISVGGKTLKYHANAGYIVLKEEEGKSLVKQPGQKPSSDTNPEAEPSKTKDGLKPKAKIFYVAYTLDDAGDPSSRPLMFAFNGGPGSSSVWLHMASVAPRRANLTDEGEAPPPPYGLTDNESTGLIAPTWCSSIRFPPDTADRWPRRMRTNTTDLRKTLPVSAILSASTPRATHAGSRPSLSWEKATAPPARPGCRTICKIAMVFISMGSSWCPRR
jgi:hypothetical protein